MDGFKDGLYEKVISEYEDNKEGMTVVRIDATKSIEEISEFIYKTLINLKIIR